MKTQSTKTAEAIYSFKKVMLKPKVKTNPQRPLTSGHVQLSLDWDLWPVFFQQAPTCPVSLKILPAEIRKSLLVIALMFPKDPEQVLVLAVMALALGSIFSRSSELLLDEHDRHYQRFPSFAFPC